MPDHAGLSSSASTSRLCFYQVNRVTQRILGQLETSLRSTYSCKTQEAAVGLAALHAHVSSLACVPSGLVMDIKLACQGFSYLETGHVMNSNSSAPDAHKRWRDGRTQKKRKSFSETTTYLKMPCQNWYLGTALPTSITMTVRPLSPPSLQPPAINQHPNKTTDP